VIRDGASIQVGAGQIPDAVTKLLAESGRKDLGVHSEAVSDWLVDLYEAGVINNSKKTLHPGKIICCCSAGSQRLYDFLDDNPVVEMHPISYTNDPEVIARNRRQVSINATIQIDLFGQCASETHGPLHYSGTGGQWNFHYGAALAEDGIGIMTMLSTGKGMSRVVPMLPQGSAVSIPRNDLHYIATEQGIVQLKGHTLEERARRLISIAHPRYRDDLEKAARDDLKLFARHAFPGATVQAAAE
jgi:acyl-CoA hydrolase